MYDLDSAIALTLKAHRGQTDETGRPYPSIANASHRVFVPSLIRRRASLPTCTTCLRRLRVGVSLD
jgi:hypothetical protein